MITAARTTSQILVHMAVAFATMYVVTGSVAFGGLAALLEPVCNVIVMPLHERLWARITAGLQCRRQPQCRLAPAAARI